MHPKLSSPRHGEAAPRETTPCSSPAGSAVRDRTAPGELRCGCGSLLARVVERRVELKCRRCKRVWTIPLEAA